MSFLNMRTHHGWGLILPLIPLCVAGVLTIHVTNNYEIPGQISPAARQSIFIGVGIVAMLVIMLINYQRMGRVSILLFLLTMVLLLWVLADRWIDLPLVHERRNARRWIFLPGFQVQPSEIMKIVYVMALAWYLRYRRNYRTLGGLIAPFLITLIPMALILVQPDLGTVLLFLPVLFAMLFVAGARISHLAVIVLLGALCMPLFWIKIKGYQRLRITSVFLQSSAVRDYFLNRPDVWDRLCPKHLPRGEWRQELTDWESRAGYQLVHSKTAIGSGGVRGQGYGQGIFADHDLLPENDNDFIFAMIAHQWGLWGSLVLILCYGLIIATGFDMATMTHDPYGRLLAVGLSTLLAVQTITNLCMNVGLGPITGVTLPLVSAGGSSVVVSFVIMGLLLSIAQRREMPIANRPFEYDEEAGRFADMVSS